MKTALTILVLNLFLQTFGQGARNIKCDSDTFDLILAYEVGGQFYLDDMIIKEPEFVEFTGDKITLQNYKHGVYRLPTFKSNLSTYLKSCDINLGFDSIKRLDSIAEAYKINLDSLKSKTWHKTNEKFAGKSESLTGEKIDVPALEFKYKIFRIKFVAFNADIVTRGLINMDKKSKKEKEIIDLTHPVFIMTKILNTKTVN